MNLCPNEIAKQINFPVKQWPGQCYAVACMMLDAGVIKGRDVYGHYQGYVSSKSMFAGNLIVRHGWIETPDKKIVDPTRWVFENKEPYIYIGKNDNYDEGGDGFRTLSRQPKPDFSASERQLELDNSTPSYAVRAIAKLPPSRQTISMSEAFWVANLSRAQLGTLMIPVYSYLINNNLKALIPLDNYKYAFLSTNHTAPQEI